MRIQVMANREGHIGYGRMADELCNAFERAGVDVVEYDRNGRDKTSHIMFMCPPQRPENWYEGQHVSLVTMWESTELAFEHLGILPLIDQVFVPSEQNLEIFSKVNPNTSLFHLGCDYGVWNYTPRSFSEPFTVIASGKGARRKGIDVSIKVFKRFRQNIQAKGYPAPRLIIKSDVNLKNPDLGIIVIDERMTPEEEAAFYAKGHVYLCPSRGEGWGMIPHQTIAQGMPTILTDAHGHKAFAHLGIPIGHDWCKAENEIVGRTGNWWEPNEDEALTALEDVFYHYELHLERAKINAQKITEFTWDRGAAEILSKLPHLPDTVKSNKEVIAPKAYLTLKVNRAIQCNIGAGNYHFVPGKEYQVSPDVKRVMYDAGYLDESCLDVFERALYEKPKVHIDEGILV
jgi:glycosyltransferase involved in cell wall biosynthesis